MLTCAARIQSTKAQVESGVERSADKMQTSARIGEKDTAEMGTKSDPVGSQHMYRVYYDVPAAHYANITTVKEGPRREG